MKFQLHTNFHCLGCKFLVKLKKNSIDQKNVIMKLCLTPKITYNIFHIQLLHFVILIFHKYFSHFSGSWAILGGFFFFFFILEVLGIFWCSNKILVNLDISRGISVEMFGNFEDSEVILGVTVIFDKFECFRDTLIILKFCVFYYFGSFCGILIILEVAEIFCSYWHFFFFWVFWSFRKFCWVS